MNQQHINNLPCPCGSGITYQNCCGSFICHEKLPATPEELMRSRYTAYHEVNMHYIIDTMKSPAADHFDVEEARAWAESVRWTGLEIIQTHHDGNKGIVEFRAHYVMDGKKCILHEVSEFIRDEGKWYYVNGTHPEKKSIINIKKIGRNDSCPCGSNKKYKKCCGS